jgi:hypothetical protein
VNVVPVVVLDGATAASMPKVLADQLPVAVPSSVTVSDPAPMLMALVAKAGSVPSPVPPFASAAGATLA